MKTKLNESKTKYKIPLLLLILSFGPYIAHTGFRYEQITIYGILFLLTPMLLIGKIKIPILYLTLLVCIFYTAIYVTIITLATSNYTSLIGVMASFESYAQPVAIIIIMSYIVNGVNLNNIVMIFTKTRRLLVFMLVINTTISITSLFVKIPFIVDLYTFGNNSVMQNALNNGRYTGIFNQPMEAGLTYSLGLLMLIYEMKVKQNLNAKDIVSFVFIVVGGFLSASKIFMVGGMMISILYLVSWKYEIRKVLKLRFIIAVISCIFVMKQFVKYWSGKYLFDRLLSGFGYVNHERLDIFMGGRIGDTSLKESILQVWHTAPVTGLGMGYFTVFDSAYIQYFLEGGIIALFLYCMILFNGIYFSIKAYHTEEGRLMLLIYIFIVLAGLGAPIFTINRFSTILVIILCELYILIEYKLYTCSEGGL